MDWAATFKFLLNSYRSANFSQQALQRYQLACVSERVNNALRFSTFYRETYRHLGPDWKGFDSLQEISRLPVINKKQLLKQKHGPLLTTPLSTGLKTESSSGTSGTPFRVYYSKQDYFRRSITFLRALLAVGYRPGDKMLMLTRSLENPVEKPWLRWHYASITASPACILDYCGKVRPAVLYGCVTTVQLLAEALQQMKKTVNWRPRIVVTTAETLDNRSRKLMEQVFQAEVYDFYGMSEVGLIAWECKNHQGYHIAEDMFYSECLPGQDDTESQRMIITALQQETMPFIRFDTGDDCLPAEGKCSCGSEFRLISRFSGRAIDRLTGVDGAWISPYAITCAMEQVSGIKRYQVIQQELNRFRVLVATGNTSTKGNLATIISQQMKSVINSEIEVQVDFVQQMDVIPGQKFRPVVSQIPAERVNS